MEGVENERVVGNLSGPMESGRRFIPAGEPWKNEEKGGKHSVKAGDLPH
jgi:hypothetical protein